MKNNNNLDLIISGVSSNSGKTILTTSLLYYFKNQVQPFKIGPDFIDPQFHKIVSGQDSVNLDSFMMNNNQVKWLFNHYKKNINIIEGVMGLYDGEDKGCSAYGIGKLLDIPIIVLLDCSGSYITISAVLKGLLEYKKDNTIKAVVLNNISSKAHFELIKNILKQDFPKILVLGWIKKNLPSLNNRHLGLDLNDLDIIKDISKDVLQNIDMDILHTLSYNIAKPISKDYPFDKLTKVDKKLAIIYDKNFSFLYYDNLNFLKEIFQDVVIVDSTKDDVILDDCDMVYICGGYVETDQAYHNIKNSNNFKKSLIKHSKTKPVYAECAGLLYLGNVVDDKKMSGILDIDFSLQPRWTRLGYYYNQSNIKGHCFHYTKAIDDKDGFDKLSKKPNQDGKVGSWQKDKVFGTYLHTMFRNNIDIIKERFLDEL